MAFSKPKVSYRNISTGPVNVRRVGGLFLAFSILIMLACGQGRVNNQIQMQISRLVNGNTFIIPCVLPD
jgi:hypothetical protein